MSYSWYSISTYAETDFSLTGYFAVDSTNTVQEFYDASGETPQINILNSVDSQIPNNSFTNRYVEGWQGFDGNGVSINYGGYAVLLTGDTSPYNGQATFFSGIEFVTRQYTQYFIEPISSPFPVANSVIIANLIASSNQVTVNWIEPTNNGRPIDGYYLTYFNTSTFASSTIFLPYPYTSDIVTGLTNNVIYNFVVTARNSSGNSAVTSVSTGTAIPFAVPDPIVLSTPIIAGEGSVIVNWTAPNNQGSEITGYYLTYFNTLTQISSTVFLPYTSTGNTVTGLTNGNVYLFSVTAENAAGNSAVGIGSSAYATPFTVPDPIVLSTPLIASDGKVDVNWRAPYNRGSEITGYYLTYFNTLTQISSTVFLPYTSTGNTVTGLTNGNVYLFSVTAENAAGNSAVGIGSSAYATPFTVPDPIVLSTPLIASDGKVDVNWTAPYDEGKNITGYYLTYYNTNTGLVNSVLLGPNNTGNTVTGLTNGTIYTFTVTAQNAAGNSSVGIKSIGSAKPYTVPDPIILSTPLIVGNGKVTVNWTSPYDEGNTIVGYNLTYLNNDTHSGNTLYFGPNVTGNTITGLTNNNTYTFTVTAQNAAGNSEIGYGSIGYASPYSVPDSVIISTYFVHDSKVIINWSPPYDEGSLITGYNLTYYDVTYGSNSLINSLNFDSTVIGNTISGLTNGNVYLFSIMAQNAAGNSAYGIGSNVYAIPYTIPGSVIIANTIAGNTKVDINWTPPYDGGNSITGYNLTYLNTITGLGNTVYFNSAVTGNTVSGLTNNTSYFFTLSAQNIAGTSLIDISSSEYVTPYDPNPYDSITPISNICFPGKTPINTDQCRVYIENVNSSKHTINGKKIIYVTKTVTLDEHLICFDEGSLGKRCPYEKTITTKNHRIFYQGVWTEAGDLEKQGKPGISKIAYSGEFLYNILLDTHEYVNVNGIICETLEPTNLLSKICRSHLSEYYKNLLFFIMNTAIKRNNKETLTVLTLMDYENIITDFLEMVISKFYDGTISTLLPTTVIEPPPLQYVDIGSKIEIHSGPESNFEFTKVDMNRQFTSKNKSKMGFTNADFYKKI